MAKSGIKGYFPSQTVSDAEKISYDYGLKVAKAIETEWFNNDRSINKYKSNFNNFHKLDCMLEASNLFKNIRMSYL